MDYIKMYHIIQKRYGSHVRYDYMIIPAKSAHTEDTTSHIMKLKFSSYYNDFKIGLF